jgi:hypothetical protein
MRNFIMPLQEQAASSATDVVFWVVHAVYMPAFFVVSGFVSFLLLQRKGPDAFIKDRSRRLLLPLILGFFCILPLMYPVWCWGWVVRGWASWVHFRQFHFGYDIEKNLFGLMHLWFIEYLFVYAALMWGLSKLPASWPLLRGLSRPWLVILLPVAAVCVAADSRWFLDFKTAFVPEPWMLCYYGLFFAWGAAASSRYRAAPETAMKPFTLGWPVALLVSLGTGYWLIQTILASTFESPHGLREAAMKPWTQDAWVLAISLVLFAASTTWFLLGFVLKMTGPAGKVRRFLVDAAYWTYLTHLFWVGLGVMFLHWSPIAIELKLVLVSLFSWAGSLLTFAAIRRTWLGNLLGSGRSRTVAATAPAPASTP